MIRRWLRKFLGIDCEVLSVLSFPTSALVVTRSSRITSVVPIDEALLDEVREGIRLVERDHGGQNGDYKRHLVLNYLCAKHNIIKGNRQFNFHLELAYQLLDFK